MDVWRDIIIVYYLVFIIYHLLNIHLYTLYTVGMLTSWSASWCTVPYRTTSLLCSGTQSPRYFQVLPLPPRIGQLACTHPAHQTSGTGVPWNRNRMRQETPEKGEQHSILSPGPTPAKLSFSCSPEIHSLYVSIAHLDPQPPFFQTQSRIHSFSSLPP